MVAITYKLDSANGQIKLEQAHDTASGTELEKRLISCLNDAVEGAMESVLWKYKNSVKITKKDVADQARAIMQKHLDQLNSK